MHRMKGGGVLQSSSGRNSSAASKGGASPIGHEAGNKNEQGLGSTPKGQISAGSSNN